MVLLDKETINCVQIRGVKIMNKALFFNDGNKREINADSIKSRKEYLEIYRGHLFCPHPNCTATVSFAETPTFTIKKMFKTTKNSTHSEDCPYKITHSVNSNRYVSSETINRVLSERHKRDILKKLFNRNQNPDEATASGSHTHSKVQNTPSNTDAVVTPKLIASIDPNALPAGKGKREPVVKKRRCSDILSEDIGKLLALDDHANSAIISDNYVEIMLSSNITLLFYNAFNASSPVAFSLVKDLATDFIINKQDLLICFIGIVEKKQSGYQIQIMDPSLITFNNCYIYNYKSIA